LTLLLPLLLFSSSSVLSSCSTLLCSSPTATVCSSSLDSPVSSCSSAA
jgi:hypothetical protein